VRRLEGKVAFVTGAARGQGRSHCVRMAEEGANIIAIDVCEPLPALPYPSATTADLEETARQVQAAGGRIVAGKADVRDDAALRRVVDDGVAKLGRLDIVSAQAGISHLPMLAHEIPNDRWREMVDTTLTGSWNAAKVAVPHIIAGGRGGAIVFTSSIMGIRAFPNVGHYVAAKHGIVGLMRTLAVELGPHNIRVTNISPTNVPTDMVCNQDCYNLFSPEKHPMRRSRTSSRCQSSGTRSRSATWSRSTSRMRSSSSRPTRPATSRASRCPSTRGSRSTDPTGLNVAGRLGHRHDINR
jgi:(+)-trans-carveol dehydrogenase/(-)-trans-carveol dehydrogenase